MLEISVVDNIMLSTFCAQCLAKTLKKEFKKLNLNFPLGRGKRSVLKFSWEQVYFLGKKIKVYSIC
jgi:hypothetical protein